METKNNEDNNQILIDLKEQIQKLNHEKLNEHKDQIIKYFEENNVTYNDLLNTKKPSFQKTVSQFCNDKKVNGPLSKLYLALTNN